MESNISAKDASIFAKAFVEKHPQLAQAIAGEIKKGSICEDAMSQLSERAFSDDEKEFIAEEVAIRWVEDGDYDCNLDFWANIDNLIDEVAQNNGIKEGPSEEETFKIYAPWATVSHEDGPCKIVIQKSDDALVEYSYESIEEMNEAFNSGKGDIPMLDDLVVYAEFFGKGVKEYGLRKAIIYTVEDILNEATTSLNEETIPA